MGNESIKGLESFPQETIQTLIKNGYKSVNAIAISIPDDVSHDTGISLEMAEELVAKAISKVVNPPLSAAELLRKEQERGKLTTSSSALDSLLAGGPWSGEITEISGGFATGKSQLCFQLAVNAQLDPSRGGLGGNVFFVDTEGTFSATRVGELALALDLDPQSILENIMVARVLGSKHQTRAVQKINEIAEDMNIKLVVVDSIASHFRSEYIGKEKLAERQQRIMLHASSLTNLAYVYDITVVVTNQMVARVDNVTGGTRPALGEAWSHRPQTRLELRKSPAMARIARLTDSPRRPEGEEVFYITGKGIRDTPRG